MGTKNNNALFFTCSLIEYIGRSIKRTRREVTEYLGKDRIREFTSMRMSFIVSLLKKRQTSLLKRRIWRKEVLTM